LPIAEWEKGVPVIRHSAIGNRHSEIAMTWTSLDTNILLLGVLSAMACALLGNFLVLRRMSMMGDAISHAVLPGLAVAYLITDSRASWPMFVGAVVVGVLTAVLTQFIHRLGKVDESASMGVVFTALFAIGLILIRRAADAVDLDPDCVLYGDLNFAAYDTVVLGPIEIPRAAVMLGVVLVINLAFVVVLFKELRLASFDPELATTLGFSSSALHYALMTLVAITTVACFEVIGNILVVAMLIVPAAAAYLLTDRLGVMIVLSLIIAVVSAVAGHIGASTVPEALALPGTSSAGAMAAATGLIFLAAMLFAPRQGVVSKLYHRWALSTRIAGEDLLGTMYRDEERGQTQSALSLRTLFDRFALRRLLRRGWVQLAAEGHALTPQGRDEARALLRSHRLWETYLADQLPLAPDHTHASAERLEHITDPAMRERLRTDTAMPARDPQGKPIPEERPAGAG
jgi:manganese/zinc/iron transport system permease protein